MFDNAILQSVKNYLSTGKVPPPDFEEHLARLIAAAKDDYYYGDGELLSDRDYDELERFLKKYYPNNPLNHQVGGALLLLNPKPTKALILRILKHIFIKRRRYRETSPNYFSRVSHPQIIKIVDGLGSFTIVVVNPQSKYQVTISEIGKVTYDKSHELATLFGKNLQFDIREYL